MEKWAAKNIASEKFAQLCMYCCKLKCIYWYYFSNWLILPDVWKHVWKAGRGIVILSEVWFEATICPDYLGLVPVPSPATDANNNGTVT